MSSTPDGSGQPRSDYLQAPNSPPAAPLKDATAIERPQNTASPRGRTTSGSAPAPYPRSVSGTSVTLGSPTPSQTTIADSVFAPSGSRLSVSAASRSTADQSQGAAALIAQAFAPHVSVLSSADCEELVRNKGLHGGLLELLRPFGEQIPGRVVSRDSNGASRPWDDFGIRFVGVKDGLEAPRLSRKLAEPQESGAPAIEEEYRPARLRSGGDVAQTEQLVERKLEIEETDKGDLEGSSTGLPEEASSFYSFFLRRLLSGPVLSPHETFAHPVALVIAISSRCESPIEELRTLYASSNTGEHRLPPWVNNEFLRYYVLVHDEDFDDIKKSTTLYEQMKRHFGLHCHLLRLRSTQCLPTDDESTALPDKKWTSSAEDLTDMTVKESVDESDESTPYIFESDAAAIRSFVREMVTQSIIPGMERSVAVWNDQVASRRRGISGRFMSLSKRFAPFGNRSNSPSTNSGSNFDSAQGFYRPEAPEAIIRKLADYAMMLRDYKLAQSTYEMLCSDFKNDKAWKYYAGANEMAAMTSMLSTGAISGKFRTETIDQQLENAYYSYIARCHSQFYSLRTLIMGAELLRLKEGSSLDDAARWLSRLLEDRNVGPVGHALVLERIGSCFALNNGAGVLQSGSRKRKAAFWTTLAVSAWLEMDKPGHAARTLQRAVQHYGVDEDGQVEVNFAGMQGFLAHLESAVGPEAHRRKVADGTAKELEEKTERMQLTTERVDQRTHSRSVSSVTGFDPLGAVPASPLPGMPTFPERVAPAADGFE